jgi:hypothetical protein
VRTLTIGLLFALMAVPASAKDIHLDLGMDVGKAYSIVDGAFVPSSIPSVTVLFGPVELSTSTYFYGQRFYEQDTHFTWYQRESDTRRWSLFAAALHYKWPGGQDFNGQAGIRWRLR